MKLLRGKTKYNSERTEYNGVWYDSKREATHARQLDLLRNAAELRERVFMFDRQVSFRLPGMILYRCDFKVVYADGHIEYHEVKGYETPQWKLKMRLMKERYPKIKIKVIK